MKAFTKRKPTPEQSAKAAARRDQFKALAKRVSAMSEDERGAIVARVGAVVSIDGARPLSRYNTCLLLCQLPTVSVVGGFWQWKTAGRRVRKGESALSLWIPTNGAKGDGQAEPTGDQIEGEAKKAGRSNFIVGSVFDISQTEPEPTAAE